MPRKVVRKERGVFEKEPGSDIWWIRFKDAGVEHLEKVGRRYDFIHRIGRTLRTGRLLSCLRLLKCPAVRTRYVAICCSVQEGFPLEAVAPRLPHVR